MFLVYNWKVKCLLLLHFVEDNICAHLIFLKVVWNNFVQIEHRTPDYFSSWHLCTNLCFSSLKYIYSLTVFNMEKAVATHSITLAWKIPWAEEPGRLQSMGSWRVGHDWATSLSLFTFMHWRRKWNPIPIFLPGGSQGQGSLVGCRLWGYTESDTTEAT